MKENTSLSFQYYGESDLGLVRKENQDSFGKFPFDSSDLNRKKGILFIVADGMGGHTGGKEASQSAVKIVGREYFLFSSNIISESLRYAFKDANMKIFQSSNGELDFRMKGTTCTALVLENNYAHIAHIGDSKIFRIHNNKIEQLTCDHTQVGEMVRKGIITEEEAKDHPSRSVLVRALGIEENIQVDVEENIPLKEGQCFIICSDGLGRVNKEEIKEIVMSETPSKACKKLIQLANDRGGNDNVTVQVIKIKGNGLKQTKNFRGIKNFISLRWLKVTSILLTMITLIIIIIFLVRWLN